MGHVRGGEGKEVRRWWLGGEGEVKAGDARLENLSYGSKLVGTRTLYSEYCIWVCMWLLIRAFGTLGTKWSVITSECFIPTKLKFQKFQSQRSFPTKKWRPGHVFQDTAVTYESTFSVGIPVKFQLVRNEQLGGEKAAGFCSAEFQQKKNPVKIRFTRDLFETKKTGAIKPALLPERM